MSGEETPDHREGGGGGGGGGNYTNSNSNNSSSNSNSNSNHPPISDSAADRVTPDTTATATATIHDVKSSGIHDVEEEEEEAAAIIRDEDTRAELHTGTSAAAKNAAAAVAVAANHDRESAKVDDRGGGDDTNAVDRDTNSASDHDMIASTRDATSASDHDTNAVNRGASATSASDRDHGRTTSSVSGDDEMTAVSVGCDASASNHDTTAGDPKRSSVNCAHETPVDVDVEETDFASSGEDKITEEEHTRLVISLRR